jgi:hypothetical protein
MEKRGIKERSTSPTNKRRRISLSERTASSPEFSASQPTNYGAHVHLPKTSSLSAWDSTCERAADAGLLTIHSSNDSMRVDSQQLQSNSLLMTSLLQPDCQLGAHPPASHPEGSHLQADYSNQAMLEPYVPALHMLFLTSMGRRFSLREPQSRRRVCS